MSLSFSSQSLSKGNSTVSNFWGKSVRASWSSSGEQWGTRRGPDHYPDSFPIVPTVSPRVSSRVFPCIAVYYRVLSPPCLSVYRDGKSSFPHRARVISFFNCLSFLLVWYWNRPEALHPTQFISTIAAFGISWVLNCKEPDFRAMVPMQNNYKCPLYQT